MNELILYFVIISAGINGMMSAIKLIPGVANKKFLVTIIPLLIGIVVGICGYAAFSLPLIVSIFYGSLMGALAAYSYKIFKEGLKLWKSWVSRSQQE